MIEGTTRPEHTEKLAERLAVALLAPVADRREEAKHGVKALVLEGQLAEVRLDPLRPLDLTGEPPRFGKLDARAIDSGHVKAELGQRNRVAAKAGRDVEDVGGRIDLGQFGGHAGLLVRVALPEQGHIGRDVDLVEELVPGLVRVVISGIS